MANTDTTGAQRVRLRWMGLLALLVAEAMNVLDATVVQIAGPTIHAEFGGSPTTVQWFSAAYTLPFALTLITGGRLGDACGRKRVFLLGVAVFTLASIACALAPSAATLIVARIVQGAAAAAIIPQTFGLIRAMFVGVELSRALGTIGPVMGLAAVCGPVLGAVVTHADLVGSSWRAVFLINVPPAVAVLGVGSVLVEDAAEHRPRWDLPGTLLAVAGTALVTYPVIEGQSWGWPAWTWLFVAAGVAVLVAFALAQRAAARRGAATLVETSLFSGRAFPAALVTSTLFFAVMNGLMLVIVLHLQIGLGRDVLSAGLTLLPWSAGSAVASLVAGTYLVPRFGNRVMFAGLAVLGAGLAAAIAAYALTPAGSAALLAALAVSGVGLGLFTVPFFTVALSRVDPQETGSAAGLLNAVQQLGATLGIAALGAVFFHGLSSPGPIEATAAVENTFWVALVLTGAATAAAAAMLITPRPRTEPQLVTD
jgi:EmrB/QacA subfamily drug resistance transporter